MEGKRESSIDRVRNALMALGSPCQVVTLPTSTRTAADAALAIGCEVAQIAKSIIFRGKHSGQPVLVIASGCNRVDEARIARELGEPILKASADFVREHTGFAIGGVAPVGYASAITVLIDEDLFKFDAVYASAGGPESVFRTSATELQRMTHGKSCLIC